MGWSTYLHEIFNGSNSIQSSMSWYSNSIEVEIYDNLMHIPLQKMGTNMIRVSYRPTRERPRNYAHIHGLTK